MAVAEGERAAETTMAEEMERTATTSTCLVAVSGSLLESRSLINEPN